MPIFRAIAAIFGSYRLVVVLLSILLLLTFLGTLEQTRLGLYEVQKRYFESFVLVHKLFDVIPVPLPGAYPTMALLFLNLTYGGIMRARKNWRTPGMLIAHCGILVLLAGGFVTYTFSTNGNMLLHEGDVSDCFESYYDWVIEIASTNTDDSQERLIIGTQDIADMSSTDSRRFCADRLPFEIIVSGFAGNTRPVPAGSNPHVKAVDGFYLETLPPEKEAERNISGAYIAVVDKATGVTQEAILWGLAVQPFTYAHNGREWTIHLRRERWPIPFSLALDKFTMERHPGTEIPKVFLSDITKIEGASFEKMKITMNEPLRHRGYTFFQASWGPQNAQPGEPLYSVFSVVRNPADHWPLYSCIIVGVGLAIHFCQKLTRFLIERNRISGD